VAEIMRLFADRALTIAAVQRKATGFNRQEAGERSEQAGLSRPVRTSHDERRASGGFEREFGDDSPPPALDRQVPGSQPHWVSVRAHFARKRLVLARRPASPQPKQALSNTSPPLPALVLPGTK